MTIALNRRSLLACCVLTSAGLLAGNSLDLAQAAPQPAPEDKPIPVTGTDVPELASFDRVVMEIMRKWRLPGGAAAVAKDGRLLLARGYGLADVEKNEPVKPDALFRIASVSKPITAAVILRLVEQGKLDLDAKPFEVLKGIEPPPGKQVDPRLRQITVRQLLHHTAGFDREKSLDPMLRSRRVARSLGVAPPPDQQAILRFMMGQPLDFDPGTKYAYSNFGYCVLGRIIEKVTGKNYAEATKAMVLEPAGITRMRLGRTRLEDRAADEVRYYGPSGHPLAASVYPEVKDKVPAPYGSLYLDAMDSHGGWIASAADVVRFTTALDGTRKPGLLKPETVRLIEERPAPPLSADATHYYGFGWNIHPVGRGANWSHCGGLPGTATIVVRTQSGMAWAVLFNSNPDNDEVYREVDRAMWKAAGQVREWPDRDLSGKSLDSVLRKK